MSKLDLNHNNKIDYSGNRLRKRGKEDFINFKNINLEFLRFMSESSNLLNEKHLRMAFDTFDKVQILYYSLLRFEKN